MAERPVVTEGLSPISGPAGIAIPPLELRTGSWSVAEVSPSVACGNFSMLERFASRNHFLLDTTTAFLVVSRAEVLATWTTVGSTVYVQDFVRDVDSSKPSPRR